MMRTPTIERREPFTIIARPIQGWLVSGEVFSIWAKNSLKDPSTLRHKQDALGRKPLKGVPMRGMRSLPAFCCSAMAALVLSALASARAQARYEEVSEIEDYERDRHLKENGETVNELLHQLKESKVTNSKKHSSISGEIGNVLLIPATVGKKVRLTAAADLRAPNEQTKFSATTEAINSQPTNTKAYANDHLTMSPECSS